MKANVYAAYYLAYGETFARTVEYAKEVEDAAPGTVLEAVEYCGGSSCGEMWAETEGATEWVRNFVLRVLHDDGVENGNDAEGGKEIATVLTKEPPSTAPTTWHRHRVRVVEPSRREGEYPYYSRRHVATGRTPDYRRSEERR